MLTVEWETKNGWGAPRIIPYQDLKIDPAATSLHYGEWSEYRTSFSLGFNLILSIHGFF